MIDKQFGDLEIGQRGVSCGRTMTETDVVNFCMLTGNWLELHSNVEFAKQTLHGQRIVQGSLIFSIVNALIPFDTRVVECFYGVERLRFPKPTFIGDTIRAETEVIKLVDRNETHGLATTHLTGINQRAETIMSCEFTLLIRKVAIMPEKPGHIAEDGA